MPAACGLAVAAVWLLLSRKRLTNTYHDEEKNNMFGRFIPSVVMICSVLPLAEGQAASLDGQWMLCRTETGDGRSGRYRSHR